MNDRPQDQQPPRAADPKPAEQQRQGASATSDALPPEFAGLFTGIRRLIGKTRQQANQIERQEGLLKVANDAKTASDAQFKGLVDQVKVINAEIEAALK